MWDKTKAVNWLDSHAQPSSQGQCAKFTREAIEAGGLALKMTNSAKDYGPSLTAAGLRALPANQCFAFRTGDVAIIQPIAEVPDGHMCMFDGKVWVSDFVQTQPSSPYPGPAFRAKKPPYAIYRYPG